jgi:hypothetical protein
MEMTMPDSTRQPYALWVFDGGGWFWATNLTSKSDVESWLRKYKHAQCAILKAGKTVIHRYYKEEGRWRRGRL